MHLLSPCPPNRRPGLVRRLRLWLLLVPGSLLWLVAQSAGATPPNVVLIFADDLGYGDLGCYGARDVRTPHLDRLAREGIRFTSFYAAQAVCSASRAALLTGCYPNRIGLLGALGPGAKTGLNPAETTLAEMLRDRGYATAIYGKWHLGDAPPFLPTRHGFDEYFGLPYSNDMWPRHPENPRAYPPLPLIEGEKVIQPNVSPDDQRFLTSWYTERAVAFIARHRTRPFFLYLPHSMPHVPLYTRPRFEGKSPRGLHGDVIQEIDASVGAILRALRRQGLEEQTLVIFTSDNGPWLLYGDHAGSAGPFREGKATMFEGGVRVPCVMRWPGRIPPGTVCPEIAATIDLLPTLASLTGASLPRDRILDGRDLRPLLEAHPGARSPHSAYYYYWGRQLQAVRSGPWKLHFPHNYPQPSPAGGGGQPGRYATRSIGLELFHLEDDPAEARNLASLHPEVVERLQRLAEQAREDLGDADQRPGRSVRPAGQLPN